MLDCEAKLAGGRASREGAAIVVNSGNANAFTGRRGQEGVDAVTGAVAEALCVPQGRVFSSSTGVIGEPLPHERITAVVAGLAARLSPDGIADAVQAAADTVRGGKRESEKMREQIRLAVRKVAKRWTGKQPIVDVLLIEG